MSDVERADGLLRRALGDRVMVGQPSIERLVTLVEAAIDA